MSAVTSSVVGLQIQFFTQVLGLMPTVGDLQAAAQAAQNIDENGGSFVDYATIAMSVMAFVPSRGLHINYRSRITGGTQFGVSTGSGLSSKMAQGLKKLSPKALGQRVSTEVIVATWHHEMLTPDGDEVAAGLLKPGDLLGGIDFNRVVVDVERIPLKAEVFNLTVAEAHTYFVGGIATWVHNVECPVNLAGTQQLRGDFGDAPYGPFAKLEDSTPKQGAWVKYQLSGRTKAHAAWSKLYDNIGRNRLGGSAFEKTSLKQLDISKNSVLIDGVGGKHHIPDGLDGLFLTEIKNSKNLSNSPQMRAFLDHAKNEGLQFRLIISEKTKVISGPLQKSIKAGKGKVLRFDTTIQNFVEIQLEGNKVQ